MRRFVGLVVFLLIGWLSATAHAQQRVADYAIDVEVPAKGADATFTVRIVYAAGGGKTEGFKFFGDRDLTNLDVTDAHGTRVRFSKPSGGGTAKSTRVSR